LVSDVDAGAPLTSVDDWLSWQQTRNRMGIVLGLERVAEVWARLAPEPFACPVVTVGGTNGKGSCVALLEAVYRAAGYRTGAYTSPHLLRYNERIRIDGAEIGDAALCAAFARVDAARGDTPLTYFEFGTLAALDLFARAQLDVVVLEVGLGGRLDAVNLIDADLALVTTIGLDHTAWLGEDRERIAVEKAGIFRPGRPAIIGEQAPPATLRAQAERLGCQVYQLGREYGWLAEGDASGWSWRGPDGRQYALPSPLLRGRVQYDNAAAVVMALRCGEARLPVPVNAIRQGLQRVQLPGRFQVLPGSPTWILDVAHNGEAADALAANLRAWRGGGQLHAVMAVLADKAPQAIAAPLVGLIDRWHLTQTSDPRAMPVAQLAAQLAGLESSMSLRTYARVEEALAGAAGEAAAEDAILVLGTFTAVEAALRRIGGRSRTSI